jgi:hypothetical protein
MGGKGGTGGTGAVTDYTSSPCYGEARSTEVYDFGTHMTKSVSATCRAEGDRAVVYVEDDLWENPFGQDEVNAFMAGYEERGATGSYRPDLGVIETDELVFGGLDGPLNQGRLTNGKLAIFVISSGGAGEGYLCSWCDALELHLDGPLLRSLHTDRALSIAAHETVHAIHRGYDDDETVWVDETLAQAAMTVNGYFTDQAWLESFLHQTNTAWGPGIDDPRSYNYGAGLLFGTYLWERDGAPLLSAIVKEPLDDFRGLDAALESVGDPATGFEAFEDMAIAVYLDDPSSGYAFDAFELDGAAVAAIVDTGTTYADKLAAYGIVYVLLDDAARELTLEAPASVKARLVLDGTPAVVEELPLGARTAIDGTLRVLVITGTTEADFSLKVE